MNDQEINEAVAKKVGHELPAPNYCRTDAAYELIEYASQKGYEVRIARQPNGSCQVALDHLGNDSETIRGDADSVSMAICQAVMKLPD